VTGSIAVPLDPQLTEREFRHAFALCRPSFALDAATAAAARAVAESVGTPLVVAADPPALAAARTNDGPAAAVADPLGVVELLFTSGTTSAPKAVM
jgi:acyl-CoA synthetase (AMP-forming)/AMP-acid ligase II